MEEKPKEQYEPGELSRTRSALGPLTKEEARRMAAVLGGDVGIERGDAGVEQKYQNLGESARRKTDHFTKKVSFTGPGVPGREVPGASGKSSAAYSGSGRGLAREDTIPQGKTSVPYRDRVKINFLAARNEHRIKTKGAAFLSLFSLILPVKDKINPAFIEEGDILFFKHIENLVISVRGLLALNRKNNVKPITNSLYLDILMTIAEWDIETLHTELNHLQRSAGNLHVESCADLCRIIYMPMMRLINLDPVLHIGKAVRHAYEYDMAGIQKKTEAHNRINNFYSVAAAEIPFVFKELRFRLYPLLLKLLNGGFCTYDYFFKRYFPQILGFVGLKAESIIADLHEPAKPSAEAPEKKEAELETIPREMPDAVLEGLSLLDRLFPEAGFGEITAFPDMYAYFHPLFAYSRGVELIPPGDPLHQVITLLSIAQELFYGFRTISFGFLRDEKEKRIDLQPLIDGLTGSWHLYIDDLIIKQYCSILYEYCRQVERTPDFDVTEYGLKLSSDLLWLKRIYFLPHMTFQTYAGRKPALTTGIPKLHEETAKFKDLLERIMKDLEKFPTGTAETGGMTAGGITAVGMTAVTNPREQILFEIESPVHKRLRQVMGRESVEWVNASLIRYTLEVITVLDYLINDETGFYYKSRPETLYRCDPVNRELPVYTAALKDPLSIFKQLESGAGPGSAPAPIDEESGFYTQPELKEKVKASIQTYLRDKKTFSLVSLIINIQGNDAQRDILEKKLEYHLRQTIRDLSDLPFRLPDGQLVALLPETAKDDALRFTIRLLTSILKAETEHPGPQPLGIAVIEFHRTWGPEKVLKILAAARAAGFEKPPPSILMYNPQKNQFDDVMDSITG